MGVLYWYHRGGTTHRGTQPTLNFQSGSGVCYNDDVGGTEEATDTTPPKFSYWGNSNAILMVSSDTATPTDRLRGATSLCCTYWHYAIPIKKTGVTASSISTTRGLSVPNRRIGLPITIEPTSINNRDMPSCSRTMCTYEGVVYPNGSIGVRAR